MSNIKEVKLGSQGMTVATIGLGCMGMTTGFGGDIYGKADENEAIATIHRSLELGGIFLDTADIYGPFLNERMIAKAIKSNREKYIIATKFGFEIEDNEQVTGAINGSKSYVKKAVERSLKNLGTDYIDLYYLHRLDTITPIEETVEAMGELGISLIAYSPVGRGFLNGTIQKPEDFNENDFRKFIPKYQGEQFYKNVELIHEIKKVADEKSITAAQLTVAWVIAKGHMPIPGTKCVKYVDENITAAGISLTQEDLNRLEGIIPLGTETGNRYDAQSMKCVNL